MRDLMTACTAGYLQQTPIIDMSFMEETGGGPEVIIALQTKAEKLVMMQMDGRLRVEILDKIVDLGVRGCGAVAVYMRQTLLEHTKRQAVAKGVVK